MATKRQKKRKSIIPKLILVLFVVYSAGVLISHQIQGNKYKNEEKELDELIVTETMKRDQLEQRLNAEVDEEYMINEAHEMGYSFPNEVIIKDTSGS